MGQAFLPIHTDTVRKMLEKVYTQVPILEDGRMVGVFSESSLIEMFKEGNDIANDPHVRFENILEYIDIDREKKILNNIFDYLKDKIVIVISHRFNNKKLFDRVIKIKDGDIIEL